MLVEYSDYVLGLAAIVMGVLGFVLKREHQRLENLEAVHSDLADRLATAINDIAKNNVADREWRKRVEENHHSLLKADEDRRNDTRKIYDKIADQEKGQQKELQRLGELIAGK